MNFRDCGIVAQHSGLKKSQLYDERAIIVCQVEQDKLHIYDIITEYEISFQSVINKVAAREIQEVIFHFTADFKGIEVMREVSAFDEV